MNKSTMTVASIQAKVCAHYGIPMSSMASSNRERRFARPRQVAMYLARELTPQSYPQIGRLFGGRDHATVMHGVRMIASLRQHDSEIDAQIRSIQAKLSPAFLPAEEQSPAILFDGVGDPRVAGA